MWFELLFLHATALEIKLLLLSVNIFLMQKIKRRFRVIRNKNLNIFLIHFVNSHEYIIYNTYTEYLLYYTIRYHIKKNDAFYLAPCIYRYHYVAEHNEQDAIIVQSLFFISHHYYDTFLSELQDLQLSCSDYYININMNTFNIRYFLSLYVFYPRLFFELFYNIDDNSEYIIKRYLSNIQFVCNTQFNSLIKDIKNYLLDFDCTVDFFYILISDNNFVYRLVTQKFFLENIQYVMLIKEYKINVAKYVATRLTVDFDYADNFEHFQVDQHILEEICDYYCASNNIDCNNHVESDNSIDFIELSSLEKTKFTIFRASISKMVVDINKFCYRNFAALTVDGFYLKLNNESFMKKFSTSKVVLENFEYIQIFLEYEVPVVEYVTQRLLQDISYRANFKNFQVNENLLDKIYEFFVTSTSLEDISDLVKDIYFSENHLNSFKKQLYNVDFVIRLSLSPLTENIKFLIKHLVKEDLNNILSTVIIDNPDHGGLLYDSHFNDLYMDMDNEIFLPQNESDACDFI